MKTYTVHFPKGTADITADALAGATLIRDGFSWGAFLFGPLWLFWNRLWLAGFLVLAALMAFSVVFDLLHVGEIFTAIANFVIMLLTGLEGNSLKRWTFERRGRPVAGVVAGSDEAEAEARMIADGLHRRSHAEVAAPVAAPPKPSSVPAAASRTTGLFPLLESPR